MKNMFSLFREYRGHFVLFMLCYGFVALFAAIFIPGFQKVIFDVIIEQQNIRKFVIMAIVFVPVFCLLRLVQLRFSIFKQKLKNEISASLVKKLLCGFYAMPYIKVQEKKPEYFTSLIFKEPVSASEECVNFIFMAVEHSITAVATVIMMIFLSKKAFFIMFTLPFLFVITTYYGKKIKFYFAREKEDEANLRAVLLQCVEAYKTVNIFGLRDLVKSKIDAQFDRYSESSLERIRNERKNGIYSEKFFSFFLLATYTLCGIMLLRHEITFGSVMAYMSALNYAANSILNIVSLVPEYAKNNTAVRRFADLYEYFPKYMSQGGESSSADGVSMHDVDFSFGDKKILDGFTLEARPGDRMLLEGRNGTGKSTIANIICGFFQPKSGKAERPSINDISACISPHGFIPGTLADNLNYGNLTPQARKYADSLLEKFGLSEKLQSRPDDMSAGQKKKAEVIMGLLKEAKLYIFDEPLANVDEAGKADIMEEIAARTKNASLLAIIHGDEQYYGMFSKRHELGKQ